MVLGGRATALPVSGRRRSLHAHPVAGGLARASDIFMTPLMNSGSSNLVALWCAPDSRATAESRRAAARLLHTPPAAREVVNVREQGHRRRDHDEAVKMVNFSQTRKPAKCDLPKQTRKSLVPGSWLPGSWSEDRYGDAVRGSFNSYKL